MKDKIVSLKSQQGDVLLRRLEKMPKGEQRIISRKRCVLAHGESGHSHVIEDDDATLIQIGERMLLVIERQAPAAPGKVGHEEHRQHQLRPGIWDIGRVQEFDYYSRMARPVQD